MAPAASAGYQMVLNWGVPDYPEGVDTDSFGNVYVSGTYGSVIYKYNAERRPPNLVGQ